MIEKEFDPKIIESLYSKIPELRHNKVIGLQSLFFKRLNDAEFIIFYQMPGLIIRVTPRCMEYIEARRIELKLLKAQVKIED